MGVGFPSPASQFPQKGRSLSRLAVHPLISSVTGWRLDSFDFAPKWLPRQDSHLFDLVQSQAGYCYLTRPWSSTEGARLLLRFGRSWQTALSVGLSTPVLRKVVPRIGLAPMTSCSSGRRSTWTELPWVEWWVRGELHSHEKSRRPLKPVRLLFRHGPAEMVGRTGLAPVKPEGQRFYGPPVLLLTHRPG